MRVLHYSLGFPPYRTGGLTKFCMDLMQTQIEQGHKVALLWPGRMEFFGNKPVRFRKMLYNDQHDQIVGYELINPLPVPLDEGIEQIEKFTTNGNVDIYIDFLQKLKPDVIHFHTLMGLHKEMILASKILNIRLVYTTHDYFGLCPKVTLFAGGHVCSDIKAINCSKCNKSALSIKKITLLQSRTYRKLKNTRLMKKLRTVHRNAFYQEMNNDVGDCASKKEIENYQKLRDFYISMFTEMDMIHFNSSVANAIYKKYFIPKASCIVHITHSDIKDNRGIKSFCDNIKIVFLASPKSYKGFDILIDALDTLWSQGIQSFELHCYNVFGIEKPYMRCKEAYNYSELPEIFKNTDVLVAPSIWYETFGFTVLEALSFGVPVIVSENVGAKDVIPDNCGIIIPATSYALQNAIRNLTKEKLGDMNKSICENDFLFTVQTMAKTIEKKCYLNGMEI